MYPSNGNQVITREARGRGRGERGIALVSVIAVLVLLAMVATPFLLTMRDSAARGEKFLYGAKADAEAEALFGEVRSQLIANLEHIERATLDAQGGTLDPNKRPPAGATPGYDTPEEMPRDLTGRFNQSTAKEHRLWAAEVVDAQTLFNLNSCSYPILANILGRAEVATATTGDKTTITLTRIPDGDVLPKTGGVVRIGSECVKYKQLNGNDLVGCERGYLQGQAGNGPPHDLEIGDLVMPEVCFQLATRPFRVRATKGGDTAWVRYTNVDQARTISDLGVAALATADFERLRPYVTAWNGNAVGDGWCNPQLVRNSITKGDQTLYAKMKNVRYFGPGTMVMITNGVHADYAVVTKVRGQQEVALAGKILNDYQADQTSIYCLARSPINVNTADVSTLKLCFSGLKLRGKPNQINEKQAEDLAFFLKQWRPKIAANDKAGAPIPAGVFRDWEDLTKALEDARDAGRIDQDGFQAVLLNAMNANDSQLAFSTVPFVFRSYDVYEVRARVSLQGTSGREMAHREIRRVMEVSTTKSGTYVLETQEDFENQILKSRDAKYMATYPSNVNGHYDGVNIPPSEYKPFSTKNHFPSTDRTSGISYVQSAPGSWRYTQGNRVDHVLHFDDEKTPDGYEFKDQGPYSISVDDPYEPEKGHLALVDRTDVPGVSSEVELGLREFAVSFWYRPDWELDAAEHVIFDYGNDAELMNRVSLRYDPKRSGLVLSCADATREQRECAVVYTFDRGTWKSGEWYHIACHVHGCSPEMMELFIDGEQQGHSNIQTRLLSGLGGVTQATGAAEPLTVKDSTEGFPDQGVLLVRGPEGIELMEYSSKSEGSFTVSRRKARTLPHGSDQVLRSHEGDETVQLYGFSAPLISDAKRGGGSLDQQMGPWRPYRLTYFGDVLTLADGTIISRGLANPAAAAQVQAVTISDWDTGSVDPSVFQDLGPAGAEGLALLLSDMYTSTGAKTSNGANGNGETQSNDVGGLEIVRYQVGSTPGQVTITARNLGTKHVTTKSSDSRLRFVPNYSWGHDLGGGVEAPYGGRLVHLINGQQTNTPNGFMSAFIPFAIVARNASDGRYLDPQDKEPHLSYERRQFGSQNNAIVDMVKGYIQIDGEWICYDSFDTQGQLLTGKNCFYRDMTVVMLADSTSTYNGTTFFPFSGSSSTITLYAPPAQASAGHGGGGGNASNSDPPAAKDFNTENDTTGKGYDAPAPGGQIPAPSLTARDIASIMEFRGFQKPSQNVDYRIANTIPRTHNAGAAIIGAVAVVSGNTLENVPGIPTVQNNAQIVNDGARFAVPGFNDILTLRDISGNDEQIRVQWGFRDRHGRNWSWFAPATAFQHDWNWDRPQGAPEGNAVLSRWDSRAFTRALKFPSGEMPDGALTKAKQDFTFGKKYDGTGAATPGTIDEICWYSDFRRAPKDRPDYAFLGQVPGELTVPGPSPGTAVTGNTTPFRYEPLLPDATEFNVHMPFLAGGSTSALVPAGVPIHEDVFPDDGGVLKIDDELILYEQFEPTSGHFTNCLRGAFGTQPAKHEYEAMVIPIHAFPASRTTGGVDASAANYPLQRCDDFPDDGYIRIGNSNEIIGYTFWAPTDLSAPVAQFDQSSDAQPRDPKKAEKKAAGSIFRGRFGTTAEGNDAGDVAIAMPFRFHDRYAEQADDPEQSYLQLSWTRHGSVWKRITWDAEPKTNVQVVGLLRFQGGPPWNADVKKVIHVGEGQIPTDDRRQYLFQITDPKAMNLINVEADRVEVRLGMRYAKGAYDRISTGQAPDNWKQTPSIRKVVVEYVAPPQVLTQE